MVCKWVETEYKKTKHREEETVVGVQLRDEGRRDGCS